MATMSAAEYTKTYSTFGGCDIVPTFNGKVIGEIQAITYSLTREKVPVYTMGSPEPRSFSRGKRGIAGNLVFISFNRDALLAELGDITISKYKANDAAWLADQDAAQFISIEQWDAYMSSLANPNGTTGTAGQIGDIAFAGQVQGGGAVGFTCGAHGVDIGPVGHFQYIGHVGTGAYIQNGVAVAQGVENIKHGGFEYAGVHAPGFAGLEEHFYIVAFSYLAEQGHQRGAIVIGFRYPVAAAQVEVFDAR